MPAQPLSSFSKSKAKDLTFAPGSLFKRPELTPYILRVIENWSFTEWGILMLGCECLQGDRVAVTAMLQAIESQLARHTAILAAVETLLDKEHFIFFCAAFRSIGPSRNTRNKFVHHAWGTSDDLPDALLLQDVKIANLEFSKHVKLARHSLASGGDPVIRSIDRSEIFVWREPDFEKEVEDAEQARSIISDLSGMVWAFLNGRPTDAIRTRLSKNPLVEQRIRKAKTQT